MAVEIDQAALSAAIVSALAGAAPVATSRWSGTAAVRRGRFASPPGNQLPFAALSAPGVTSTQGEVMGAYTRRVVYDLQLWAAVTTRDESEQVIAAEALADEALQLLERARLDPASELYKVPVFGVSAQALIAGYDPLPANLLGAILVIECAYRRRTGLSGASAS